MSLAASKLREWKANPVAFVREVFGVEPDAWQADVLSAFPKHQRIAMVACKGPGKLQPKSMLVPTPGGLRRWGDIQPGDWLFAEDGTPTRVLLRHENGVVPVYRVHFDDGSFTDAGAEHLWKVRGRTERRHGTWSVLKTSEVMERGVRIPNGKWQSRQFEIPRQGAAQFPEANLEVDPYALGVWLGDGSSRSGRYTKPDLEIDRELERRGLEVVRHGQDATAYGVAPKLRGLGLLHLRSHERFVPSKYLTASVQQRLDLLRGLMDTDGCVGGDAHCEFGSTSRQLANDVIWLVRSLGGVAILKGTVKRGWYRDDDGERVDCRDCYRVTVTMPVNPFSLPRKAERWHRPQDRYLTRYIDRIELVGEEDSMCVTIEHPSHCYLANDFIVTHNSCVEAWVAWNFLLTRPHPKVIATSISGDNLRDGLWTELAKWQQKSRLLKEAFQWGAERIVAKQHPETWWAAARQWSKSADPSQQANTLAGIHADYVLFLLDESGGIPDGVAAAAEAALSTGIETKLVQGGNPTHLEGPLYRAATRERHLWYVVEISSAPDDPKRTPRVSAQWAREQIEKYGVDNPWVLVNVFGKFPPGQADSLISLEDAQNASRRLLLESEYQQDVKVMGVDVARFGDDRTVITLRHGRVAFRQRVLRNVDLMTLASNVAVLLDKHQPDACFVDATGVGAGLVDRLIQLGYSVIGIESAGKSTSERYANKRAEMWGRMAEWVKSGCLPDDSELVNELSAPTYHFDNRGRLLLEKKDDLKARGQPSPDKADSLALTFAQPVASKDVRASLGARGPRTLMEYNPYSG